MLKIRDFKCSNRECGAYTEKFVPDSKTQVDCPECHSAAIRTLSAPPFHLDKSFPGYESKWVRDHERKGK